MESHKWEILICLGYLNIIIALMSNLRFKFFSIFYIKILISLTDKPLLRLLNSTRMIFASHYTILHKILSTSSYKLNLILYNDNNKTLNVHGIILRQRALQE